MKKKEMKNKKKRNKKKNNIKSLKKRKHIIKNKK